MRDADVRAAVRARLSADHLNDPGTVIVEEMGIWAGAARIDIAVINGELAGFELKSERDTLERLGRQAEFYNQVFDRVTLVAARRHLERAHGRIPDWWGIIAVAPASTGSLELSSIRRPSLNDAIDPLQVARLLWRSEALVVLQRHGLDKGVRSKPVEVLARRLASDLPAGFLCDAVREALKARKGWLRQPMGDVFDVAIHTE